jgi:predicted nucleotidyltransferase/predicted transcriptional regulator
MICRILRNIYISTVTSMYHMLQKSNSWLVFKEFLDKPNQKHQIRKISKNINLATTSVKKHIEQLIKEKLVIEGKDIFKFYKANFENKRFRFYKKINSLDVIENSGVLNFIEDETGSEAIYLFGSIAKGEDLDDSDVDLYVQAPEKSLTLDKFEKKINKKIQLFFAEDISKLPSELRNNILNGIKLRGFIKIF